MDAIAAAVCAGVYVVGVGVMTTQGALRMSDGTCSLGGSGYLGVLLIAASLMTASVIAVRATGKAKRRALTIGVGIGSALTLGAGGLVYLGCGLG